MCHYRILFKETLLISRTSAYIQRTIAIEEHLSEGIADIQHADQELEQAIPKEDRCQN
jgi:hypothetical protein